MEKSYQELGLESLQQVSLCWVPVLSNCVPTHSRPLQVTPRHSRSLQLTPTHSRSLQPTPTYSHPLQPTAAHFRPLRPTQSHFNPLHAVLTHCRQIILTFRQIINAKYIVLFQLAWSGSYLNYSWCESFR